jgi:hypothetical protein
MPSIAYEQVMDGLKSAPSLRIVTVPFNISGESMLQSLAVNPSLEETHLILPTRYNWGMYYPTCFRHLDPRPRDLIVFQPASLSVHPTDHSTNLLATGPLTISLPSNSLFVPMAHVNDTVRDMIWDCILRFALEVDVYKDGAECMDYYLLARITCTRHSIPRVSRNFKVIPISYHPSHVKT